MKIATKSTTRSFRERDHSFTDLPVKDLLKIRMKDLDIKNVDLQKALDYARPNVIAMMKSGSMRLPAGKAAIAARLLQIDPVFLLGKIIAENDADLWESISAVMGDQLLTENEMLLVKLHRKALKGHDIDLAALPAYRQLVKPLLKVVAAHGTALAAAAIARSDE